MSVNDEIKEKAEDLLEALFTHTDVEDYQPTRDRVLIYPLPEKKAQSESGLWVPEEDKKKTAMVISSGPGILTKKGRVSPDVEPGDVIMMGAWIGEVIRLNNETYRLVRAGDIMMVMHSNEDGNADG